MLYILRGCMEIFVASVKCVTAAVFQSFFGLKLLFLSIILWQPNKIRCYDHSHSGYHKRMDAMETHISLLGWIKVKNQYP